MIIGTGEDNTDENFEFVSQNKYYIAILKNNVYLFKYLCKYLQLSKKFISSFFHVKGHQICLRLFYYYITLQGEEIYEICINTFQQTKC